MWRWPLTAMGSRLRERRFPATIWGYGELEQWSRSLGDVRVFGIEGTGSYGAGVARFLTGLGHTIVEVNRPDRSTRFRKGKSDPTDSEMAARAVLSGVADAIPKSGEGEVDMIRMLKSAKDSAVKARTQAEDTTGAGAAVPGTQGRGSIGGAVSPRSVTLTSVPVSSTGQALSHRGGGGEAPTRAAARRLQRRWLLPRSSRTRRG